MNMLMSILRAVLDYATAEDVRRDRDEQAQAIDSYMQWMQAYRAEWERRIEQSGALVRALLEEEKRP